jgi:hypothetical protein
MQKTGRFSTRPNELQELIDQLVTDAIPPLVIHANYTLEHRNPHETLPSIDGPEPEKRPRALGPGGGSPV